MAKNQVSKFRFIPVVERTIEAEHKNLRHALLALSHHGVARASLSIRAHDLWRELAAAGAAECKLFYGLLDTARVPSKAADSLGLASHPDIAAATLQSLVCRRTEGSARVGGSARHTLVRQMLAKVVYRCDLMSQFADLDPVEKASTRTREKEDEETAKVKKIAACKSAGKFQKPQKTTTTCPSSDDLFNGWLGAALPDHVAHVAEVLPGAVWSYDATLLRDRISIRSPHFCDLAFHLDPEFAVARPEGPSEDFAVIAGDSPSDGRLFFSVLGGKQLSKARKAPGRAAWSGNAGSLGGCIVIVPHTAMSLQPEADRAFPDAEANEIDGQDGAKDEAPGPSSPSAASASAQTAGQTPGAGGGSAPDSSAGGPVPDPCAQIALHALADGPAPKNCHSAGDVVCCHVKNRPELEERVAVSIQPLAQSRVAATSTMVWSGLSEADWAAGLAQQFQLWEFRGGGLFLYLDGFSPAGGYSLRSSEWLASSVESSPGYVAPSSQEECAFWRQLFACGLADAAEVAEAEHGVEEFRIACSAKLRFGTVVWKPRPFLQPWPQLGGGNAESLACPTVAWTAAEALEYLVTDLGWSCRQKQQKPSAPFCGRHAEKIIFGAWDLKLKNKVPPPLEYLRVLAAADELLAKGIVCIPHGAPAEVYQALLDGNAVDVKAVVRQMEENYLHSQARKKQRSRLAAGRIVADPDSFGPPGRSLPPLNNKSSGGGAAAPRANRGAARTKADEDSDVADLDDGDDDPDPAASQPAPKKPRLDSSDLHEPLSPGIMASTLNYSLVTQAQKDAGLTAAGGQLNLGTVRRGMDLEGPELAAGIWEILARAAQAGSAWPLPGFLTWPAEALVPIFAALARGENMGNDDMLNPHRLDAASARDLPRVVVALPIHSHRPLHWTLLLASFDPGSGQASVTYVETLPEPSADATRHAQIALRLLATLWPEIAWPAEHSLQRSNSTRQDDGWSCGFWALIHIEAAVRSLRGERDVIVDRDGALTLTRAIARVRVWTRVLDQTSKLKQKQKTDKNPKPHPTLQQGFAGIPPGPDPHPNQEQPPQPPVDDAPARSGSKSSSSSSSASGSSSDSNSTSEDAGGTAPEPDPVLFSKKLGPFRLTPKQPGKSAGEFGGFEAACPYHRKNATTSCKKNCTILGPTRKDKRKCVAFLLLWCQAAQDFDRQWTHVGFNPSFATDAVPDINVLAEHEAFRMAAPTHAPTADDQMSGAAPSTPGRGRGLGRGRGRGRAGRGPADSRIAAGGGTAGGKSPDKKAKRADARKLKKKQPNEHVAAADSASLPTPRGATSAASDSESD